MSQIQELTDKLQRELYFKKYPGEVILHLREMWLEKLIIKHPCNLDALMLGFMLADFKLDEAIALRKPDEHIRMARDYAEQAFERYSDIPEEIRVISLEIINTQHGGTQKYIESKLFKNADALSTLEPKGILHTFGTLYEEKNEQGFNLALKRLDEKIEFQFTQVDLDSDTIQEAQMLMEKYTWLRSRMLKYPNV